MICHTLHSPTDDHKASPKGCTWNWEGPYKGKVDEKVRETWDRLGSVFPVGGLQICGRECALTEAVSGKDVSSGTRNLSTLGHSFSLQLRAYLLLELASESHL